MIAAASPQFPRGSDDDSLHTHYERYEAHALRDRCAKTRQHYRVQLLHFDRYVFATFGRTARLGDLNDDTLANAMRWLAAEREWSPYTENKFRGCMVALWNWLARKRVVEEFPAVGRVKQPRRIPLAWMQDELDRLFRACQSAPGMIGDVPASVWWTALHATLLDAGSRIGETMALLWGNIDLASGWAVFEAETRKGQTADIIRKLHPRTVDALQRIRSIVACGSRSRVFPFPYAWSQLWTFYRRLLESAGLPTGRRSAFHRMRKSSASWLVAGGGNATAHLDHSDPKITLAYLDPRITGIKHAADVIRRPEAG